MALNETERAVRECLLLHLHDWKTISAYLKSKGIDITKAHYYRVRAKMEGEKLKRLHEIAIKGFEDQHLERIDTLEFCMSELWKNYFLEQEPYKKAKIIQMIIDAQPYLSSYYEVTKDLLEQNAEADRKADSLPDPATLEG